MAKITLNKALALKKKLCSNLEKIREDITTYNSVVKGGTREVECKKALAQEQAIMDALVTLKTITEAANQPKRSTIFAMSESKSRVLFLKRIDTKRGTTMSEYGRTSDELVEWTCEISKQDKDILVKEEEAKIDKYQDEMNVFNGTTYIEVPDEVIKLAS